MTSFSSFWLFLDGSVINTHKTRFFFFGKKKSCIVVGVVSLMSHSLSAAVCFVSSFKFFLCVQWKRNISRISFSTYEEMEKLSPLPLKLSIYVVQWLIKYVFGICVYLWLNRWKMIYTKCSYDCTIRFVTLFSRLLDICFFLLKNETVANTNFFFLFNVLMWWELREFFWIFLWTIMPPLLLLLLLPPLSVG